LRQTVLPGLPPRVLSAVPQVMDLVGAMGNARQVRASRGPCDHVV